jgi:selenocysteine lyase/cysteine desulfurase
MTLAPSAASKLMAGTSGFAFPEWKGVFYPKGLKSEGFLPYYAGVHRGTGFKARASTELFDWARRTIAELVHADTDRNTVIFGKNATEAINKLAHRMPWRPDAVVLTTQLEHHSNDLPFRPHAQVVHVQATADGRLDEADFDAQRERHRGRVQLVAVTGDRNLLQFPG